MKLAPRRTFRPILVLLALVVAFGGLQAQTPANLKEISVQKDAGRLVVLLKVDGTFTYESALLASPPRVVVDISPVPSVSAAPYSQVDDMGVLDIRTGQFDNDTARIVFDLSARTPSYSIGQIPDGIKITFWFEAGQPSTVQTPAAQAPAIQAPVRQAPGRQTIRSAKTAEPRAERAPGRRDFFVTARAGMTFFLKPELLINKEFNLYAETATLDETYTFGSVPVFEAGFGKYFGRIKVGAGATMWTHKQPGAFALSLPHPFLDNTPRSLSFEAAALENPSWNFFAYVLFSFLETEKFGVWAGPLVGLTTGKFQSLDDFDFTEKAPYGASDVTLSEPTYVEDIYSELLFGGILNFEYRLSSMVSLVLDTRIVYLNPKILSLGQRANLLQFQPMLGIQIGF